MEVLMKQSSWSKSYISTNIGVYITVAHISMKHIY